MRGVWIGMMVFVILWNLGCMLHVWRAWRVRRDKQGLKLLGLHAVVLGWCLYVIFFVF
jgi:hypothetical protein